MNGGRKDGTVHSDLDVRGSPLELHAETWGVLSFGAHPTHGTLPAVLEPRPPASSPLMPHHA
eukprot:5252600-Prymnesium_polylepis.1